jgi:cobyrinic acid a,c-diamide synthase
MVGRGLILAAPASGSGKTLIAAGLLRHLSRRGTRVIAAKTGPDYIDPTFHAAASGRPCVNLDLWAMRPATLAGLVVELEACADLVLCEGVMGLFDGTGSDGEAGSTAALARLTGWPVALVIDARRQGASAAALIGGFARHDPQLPLAGVIFNRVAGPRHRALLEIALARHVPGVPCLGVIPQDLALALAERHLGLIPAGERTEAETVIEHAATVVSEACDVDALLALARRSNWESTAPVIPLLPLGQRIAVARDAAFVFSYPAVLDGWCRAGSSLSFFSPLADEPPDADADAVYLPGGFPELHAGRLATAERFLGGLRRAASAGTAIYGECGGYMVLGEAMTDAEGQVHRMAGLLPLATSFAERRLHLGYRSVALLHDGPLGRAGRRFRGHEFHYATTLPTGGEALFTAADSSETDLGPIGLRRGSVAGSFIHLIDREED